MRPSPFPTSTTPAFARSLGLHGENIDDARRTGRGVGARPGADRPTVLDVRCDPDVPPIPPHATFDQAKSLVEGRRWAATRTPAGFIKQGLKQKVQQYLPGEKKPVSTNVVRTALHDVRTGRFERTLSALTAAGAAVTAGEIYLSHDGASFGNKMMYWPIVVVPTAIPAGIAGFFSRRAARTVLPGGQRRRSSSTDCRASTCTCAASSSGPAASPNTTWSPGRRRSRRCWPPWSAGWVCSRPLLRREELPLPGDGER